MIRPGLRHCLRISTLIFGVLLVLAPCLIAAPLDTQSRSLTFSFGVRGYERDSWFAEPAALALDERFGLIYVADEKAGVVDAFSTQGIAKFHYGAKNGLKSPIGLAVDKNGDVCVSESGGGPIQIINSKGEATSLDLPSAGEGAESPKPGKMTFDREGNLYVVDRANSRVVVFDKDKKLKLAFGGIGDKRGQFRDLQDVGVDRQGRIYTVDSASVPIQVFDRKGGFVYRFGVRGEGDDQLSFPTAIFIDRNDQVWVVDRSRHSLKVFDRSGAFLRKFGSYGLGEGMLFHPIDAAMDSFGRVYVLEIGSRRLQVFSLNRPFEPLTP